MDLPKPKPALIVKRYQLEQDDVDRVDQIKAATGVDTRTDAVRYALRDTAARLVPAKKPRGKVK